MVLVDADAVEAELIGQHQLVEVAVVEFVAVRGKSQGTDFVFSYTPSPDDGALGKLTFRAEADLNSSRDALFADNVAISAPVRINKGGGPASPAGSASPGT